MTRQTAIFATLTVITAIATLATPSRALAEGPQPGVEDLLGTDAHDMEDHHAIPLEYRYLDGFPEGTEPPDFGGAEYPLAISFNAAHSSNYTAGGMVSFDYITVHTVQGSYTGCQSWFQNPAANVSAHFVVRSDDGEVTQMVELADRAWHVGGSNAYAIGIEHEGWIDEPAWYTWEMYVSSSQLTRWTADELDIPKNRDHIVGHVELPNQSHTDPGIHWNWDLYMALVNDWVGEGTIEGTVVDESALCSITANADTWIKRTLESSSELGDADKCFVPAGTAFPYTHASDLLVGHKRLDYFAEDGPCAGFIGLDEQGFIFAEHFSETCDDASKAAAGVTVVLDGGQQTTTDANGQFSFTGVEAGAHTLDVLGGEAYGDALEPVDLDVFPGARVVIAVESLGGGADDSGDTGEPGDDSGDSGESGDSGDEGDSDESGDEGGDEFGDELGEGETGDAGAGELDYLDGESCACSTNPGEPWGAREGLLFILALGVYGFGAGARRKRG